MSAGPLETPPALRYIPGLPRPPLVNHAAWT